MPDVTNQSAANSIRIANAFYFLVKSYHQGPTSPLNPTTFKVLFDECEERFKENIEHDASEFMLVLLRHINDALSCSESWAGNIDEAVCLDTKDISKNVAEHWTIWSAANSTIVTRLFAGLQSITHHCGLCSFSRSSIVPFWALTLYPPVGPTTIQHLLDSYSSEEDTEWKCPCGKAASSSKQTEKLWILPKYLLLAVKRFGFDARTKMTVKCYTAPVVIQLHDTVPITAGFHLARYRIANFITHTGGAVQGGHYTCTLRHDTAWVKCDDSSLIVNPSVATVAEDAYLCYMLMLSRHGCVRIPTPFEVNITDSVTSSLSSLSITGQGNERTPSTTQTPTSSSPVPTPTPTPTPTLVVDSSSVGGDTLRSDTSDESDDELINVDESSQSDYSSSDDDNDGSKTRNGTIVDKILDIAASDTAGDFTAEDILPDSERAALKARVLEAMQKDSSVTLLAQHPSVLENVVDTLFDLGRSYYASTWLLEDRTAVDLNELVNKDFPMPQEPSTLLLESVVRCRQWSKTVQAWRHGPVRSRILDHWTANPDGKYTERQMLAIAGAPNIESKVAEVIDGSTECLIGLLKTQIDSSGCFKLHSDYAISLQLSTIERCVQYLCKFLEWLLCTRPLDVQFLRQEFWRNNTQAVTDLVQEYLYDLAWVSVTKQQRAMKGFRLRSKASERRVGKKEQARLSADKLNNIATTFNGVAVGSEMCGIGIALTCAGVYKEDSCPLSNMRKRRRIVRKVRVNKGHLDNQYWPVVAEDTWVYLEKFPPTSAEEFQEAAMFLIWCELGCRPNSFINIYLSHLTFNRQKNHRLSVTITVHEHKTGTALVGDELVYEVIQKPSKYCPFDWLVVYLTMRGVLEVTDGLPKIRENCREQPLWVHASDGWLNVLNRMTRQTCGTRVKKLGRRLGVDSDLISNVSFRKGVALKFFIGLLEKDPTRKLTWSEVQETLITKGYWLNKKTAGGYLSYGNNEIKKSLNRWLASKTMTPHQCVRFLHEIALEKKEYINPTDPLVKSVADIMMAFWGGEKRKQLALFKERAKNDPNEAALVESAISKTKDYLRTMRTYRLLQTSTLINRAKLEILNKFSAGNSIEECTTSGISLDLMKESTPCLHYGFVAARTPFIGFDHDYHRSCDPLKCIVDDCKATFTNNQNFIDHRKLHLEKLPIAITCGCGNYKRKITQKGPKVWDCFMGHVKGSHHTREYCEGCRDWRCTAPSKPNDRSSAITTRNKCIAKGHSIIDPTTVEVIFTSASSRCPHCAFIPFDGFCIAEYNWRSLVSDHMKANIDEYSAKQFGMLLLRLFNADLAIVWSNFPSCLKSALTKLFNDLLELNLE